MKSVMEVYNVFGTYSIVIKFLKNNYLIGIPVDKLRIRILNNYIEILRKTLDPNTTFQEQIEYCAMAILFKEALKETALITIDVLCALLTWLME